MIKLILTGTVLMILPGLIALIVVLTVKKNKKKNGKKSADPGYAGNTAAAQFPADHGKALNGSRPAPSHEDRPYGTDLREEAGQRRERTTMLTYNTLILKDRERPVRMYKADLYHTVYIGRDKTNRICLSDPSVSRKHLKFYRSRGLCYAENLSRANGTKLNGRYLTEPREVVSGDLIELGRMKFLVEID